MAESVRDVFQKSFSEAVSAQLYQSFLTLQDYDPADLRYNSMYLRLSVSTYGLAMNNSVVPAPIPFFNPEQMIALLFFKTGSYFCNPNVSVSEVCKTISYF